MSPEFIVAATLPLVLSTLVALVCRIGHMQLGVTKMSIFLQHGALAVAVFSCIFLPPQSALTLVLLGLVLFLAIGSPRWRRGAPKDTEKRSWK